MPTANAGLFPEHSRIYIYGAGVSGRHACDAVWQAWRKTAAGFIDNDPRAHGQHWLGIPILALAEIVALRKQRPHEAIGIVISSERHFSAMRLSLERHDLLDRLLVDFPFSTREMALLYTHPSLTYAPPVKIEEGCLLSGQNITLGRQVTLGHHSHLHGNNITLGPEVTVGAHVSIGAGFTCQGRNSIANNVRINTNVTIGRCTNININSFIGNNVTIGSFVASGHNAVLGATAHRTTTLSSSDYLFAAEAPATVIGHDVWIGAGAVIKCGVTIGTGCVIGANAFVNRDLPPYAIAVGSPARIVRHRFSPDIISKLLASRWWEIPAVEEAAIPHEIDAALTFLDNR